MNLYYMWMELQLRIESYVISAERVGLVCLELFHKAMVLLLLVYFSELVNNFFKIFCILGRLTLTNYALYFEAYGVVSYDAALKIDLSKDIEQSAKSAATGPWGAPLYDKAIVYESSEL